MRKSTLLVTCAVSVLGLTALLGWSVPSTGQPAGSPPAPDINPVIANCNVTPDTNVGQLPPPGTIVATPITPDLLTSGQPCDRKASANGLFPGERLRNLQRGFDFYSWLTFIALNSPADGSRIGPDVRTKWEDVKNYRQLADVMLSDGSAPEWGKPVVVPQACQGKGQPTDMVVVLGEEAFNQPFKSGPLIDQNSNYALFDILMNKPMFDFILEKRLYSKRLQEAFTGVVNFPSGNSPDTKDTLPAPGNPGRMGAIMLKVSWKILVPNKDVASQFHTVDALVYFPGKPHTKVGPDCVRKKLGLIGFHVGHKTDFAPQWIWTTFEHVKNAPEDAEIKDGGMNPPYNFYDPACSNCPVNQVPLLQPWDPDTTLKFRDEYKSQITRVIPIFSDAKKLNEDFHKILKGTVWENYMLVSTQWPSNLGCVQDKKLEDEPDQTCAPVPTFLANTTLETYSQGSIPIASSSCMACHKDATTRGNPAIQSDFTFTLEKAQ